MKYTCVSHVFNKDMRISSGGFMPNAFAKHASRQTFAVAIANTMAEEKGITGKYLYKQAC